MRQLYILTILMFINFFSCKNEPKLIINFAYHYKYQQYDDVFKLIHSLDNTFISKYILAGMEDTKNHQVYYKLANVIINLRFHNGHIKIRYNDLDKGILIETKFLTKKEVIFLSSSVVEQSAVNR